MRTATLATIIQLGGGGGASYQTPSYAHALGSGARSGLNGKFTTSGGAVWGTIESLGFAVGGYHADGDTASNAGYSTLDGSEPCDSTVIYQMDFTGQASPTYKADKIKFYFDTTMNCGTRKIQAYINAAWVDVSSNFVWGASATQEITLTGATGFTKLRLIGVSGTATWDAYLREIEFSIGSQL